MSVFPKYLAYNMTILYLVYQLLVALYHKIIPRHPAIVNNHNNIH